VLHVLLDESPRVRLPFRPPLPDVTAGFGRGCSARSVTKLMANGSDAIVDWPLHNAMMLQRALLGGLPGRCTQSRPTMALAVQAAYASSSWCRGAVTAQPVGGSASGATAAVARSAGTVWPPANSR
jgi:hypothetical protein